MEGPSYKEFFEFTGLERTEELINYLNNEIELVLPEVSQNRIVKIKVGDYIVGMIKDLKKSGLEGTEFSNQFKEIISSPQEIENIQEFSALFYVTLPLAREGVNVNLYNLAKNFSPKRRFLSLIERHGENERLISFLKQNFGLTERDGVFDIEEGYDFAFLYSLMNASFSTIVLREEGRELNFEEELERSFDYYTTLHLVNLSLKASPLSSVERKNTEYLFKSTNEIALSSGMVEELVRLNLHFSNAVLGGNPNEIREWFNSAVDLISSRRLPSSMQNNQTAKLVSLYVPNEVFEIGAFERVMGAVEEVENLLKERVGNIEAQRGFLDNLLLGNPEVSKLVVQTLFPNYAEFGYSELEASYFVSSLIMNYSLNKAISPSFSNLSFGEFANDFFSSLPPKQELFENVSKDLQINKDEITSEVSLTYIFSSYLGQPKFRTYTLTLEVGEDQYNRMLQNYENFEYKDLVSLSYEDGKARITFNHSSIPNSLSPAQFAYYTAYFLYKGEKPSKLIDFEGELNFTQTISTSIPIYSFKGRKNFSLEQAYFYSSLSSKVFKEVEVTVGGEVLTFNNSRLSTALGVAHSYFTFRKLPLLEENGVVYVPGLKMVEAYKPKQNVQNVMYNELGRTLLFLYTGIEVNPEVVKEPNKEGEILFSTYDFVRSNLNHEVLEQQLPKNKLVEEAYEFSQKYLYLIEARLREDKDFSSLSQQQWAELRKDLLLQLVSFRLASNVYEFGLTQPLANYRDENDFEGFLNQLSQLTSPKEVLFTENGSIVVDGNERTLRIGTYRTPINNFREGKYVIWEVSPEGRRIIRKGNQGEARVTLGEDSYMIISYHDDLEKGEEELWREATEQNNEYVYAGDWLRVIYSGHLLSKHQLYEIGTTSALYIDNINLKDEIGERVRGDLFYQTPILSTPYLWLPQEKEEVVQRVSLPYSPPFPQLVFVGELPPSISSLDVQGSVSPYNVENAARGIEELLGINIPLQGENGDEMARSLIKFLIDNGYASKIVENNLSNDNVGLIVADPNNEEYKGILNLIPPEQRDMIKEGDKLIVIKSNGVLVGAIRVREFPDVQLATTSLTFNFPNLYNINGIISFHGGIGVSVLTERDDKNLFRKFIGRPLTSLHGEKLPIENWLFISPYLSTSLNISEVLRRKGVELPLEVSSFVGITHQNILSVFKGDKRLSRRFLFFGGFGVSKSISGEKFGFSFDLSNSLRIDPRSLKKSLTALESLLGLRGVLGELNFRYKRAVVGIGISGTSLIPISFSLGYDKDKDNKIDWGIRTTSIAGVYIPNLIINGKDVFSWAVTGVREFLELVGIIKEKPEVEAQKQEQQRAVLKR